MVGSPKRSNTVNSLLTKARLMSAQKRPDSLRKAILDTDTAMSHHNNNGVS